MSPTDNADDPRRGGAGRAEPAATPSARWREEGKPDPHSDRYDCERAKLALGSMTDDELANAVFMGGDGRLDLAAIQRGEPSPISLLTAAKDRIRWLSRQLEAADALARAGAAAPANSQPLESAVSSAASAPPAAPEGPGSDPMSDPAFVRLGDEVAAELVAQEVAARPAPAPAPGLGAVDLPSFELTAAHKGLGIGGSSPDDGWTCSVVCQTKMHDTPEQALAEAEAVKAMVDAALRAGAAGGAPAGGAALTAAARDVLAERRRQVEAEGWTPEHDDEHANGEIEAAAGTYAIVASGRFQNVARQFWPWHFGWWKPCDGRRNLIKAGALILAAIERLDRAEARLADGAAGREGSGDGRS